ncbi:MAG: hypothetical protein ACK42L_09730, partial [Thermoanaerobaculum sp.]
MLLTLVLLANTVAIPEKQFVPAPKSVAGLLSQAGFLCPWDKHVATLLRGEKGFELLRFSSKSTEKLGPLEAPAEGLEFANVWGACGDTLVVMSNLKTYLYQGTQLKKPEPWPWAIAGAACDGFRVFLFPRLSPEPKSPGKEAAVKVLDLASNQEDVWLSSPPREKPEDPLPVYFTVTGALTKSGKLWVVGIYSGKVWLFSKQGNLIGEHQLPADAVPKAIGEEEQAVLRSQLEAHVTGDATRKRPHQVQTLVPTRKVGVKSLGTWEETLVVLTQNTVP